MPLRAFGFLGIYCVLLLAALAFPAAGVWGFVFESNYHPPYNKWWGQYLSGQGDRWSLYIGAVMIVSTLLHWGRSEVKVFSHPQTILLILFTLNACLVTTWAYDVDASWKEVTDKLKWLAVYVCIIKTHSRNKWMPVVLLVYVIAAIDWGWQCTFDPKSGRFIRGGTSTACFDENFVASHVVALLPLVGCYIASSGTPRWLRCFLMFGAPLMLNIVAHAQSRGAFLALLAAGLAMPVFAKGRLRTWTIIGLIVGALLSVRLFHEQFWVRMSSITQDGQTGAGRTIAWANAWELTLENPFGYGGEAFDRGLARVNKSTHNMYFECLVAWGFQGTALWLAYIGASMWECKKLIAKLSRQRTWPPRREYLDAVAMLTGLIGMLAAAVFINRMRWELWWVFPAYVICLKNSVDVLRVHPPFALESHNPARRHPTWSRREARQGASTGAMT